MVVMYCAITEHQLSKPTFHPPPPAVVMSWEKPPSMHSQSDLNWSM